MARRPIERREAADPKGKDVRIGGGVATVREFLDADLIDAMHIVVAPVELGRGERLWTSPDELVDRFHLEQIPSPSWRWGGVPIFDRAGKCLPVTTTEVRVELKRPPIRLFQRRSARKSYFLPQLC